jgi:N-acetyl-beta-hexosaminidase
VSTNSLGSNTAENPAVRLVSYYNCDRMSSKKFILGGQLNPKNNNTFKILNKLYEELLKLTEVTDFFHIGGDEVNFNCWNQYFKMDDPKKLWCDFM